MFTNFKINCLMNSTLFYNFFKCDKLKTDVKKEAFEYISIHTCVPA